MGESLPEMVLRHPATSAVNALLVGLFLWLRHRAVAPGAVAMSYQNVVTERQWWRALVAQVAHFDVLHLVLNVSSCYGLAAQAEPALRPGASWEYLRVSFLLLLLSAGIMLGLEHAMLAAVARAGLDGDAAAASLRQRQVVGYSGVLFGQMALIAWTSGSEGRFNLLGLTSVPMLLAPFLLAAVSQLVMPNSSALGHLAGILGGLLLASGALDWVTAYWTVCLAMWVAIGVAYGLVREGRLGLPYVRVLPGAGDVSEDEAALDLMERGEGGGVSEVAAGGGAGGGGGGGRGGGTGGGRGRGGGGGAGAGGGGGRGAGGGAAGGLAAAAASAARLFGSLSRRPVVTAVAEAGAGAGAGSGSGVGGVAAAGLQQMEAGAAGGGIGGRGAGAGAAAGPGAATGRASVGSGGPTPAAAGPALPWGR
ncbi:hypothetical protein HXX76_009132 [Chlamydomonas incerta]|uniref:Peptidase S54 rhomboid domain-containing protein n=1 Tax=Chlamydomonas incerta TaxID=51695 RepID=A0A835SY99_CHLIN|nr:hypothetical protein HXX76_009132 [Chlamydomonas incerta]|eukprot:KAG2432213.1 hypothetical protein HXX76_009132 [Chlamydomonas incerta]